MFSEEMLIARCAHIEFLHCPKEAPLHALLKERIHIPHFQILITHERNCLGASVVVLWVKVPAATLTSPVGADSSPGDLTLSFFTPVSVPGKAIEDFSRLGPLHWWRDLDQTPGSWFWHGSTLPAVALWGVNQKMQDLSVPHLLSLCTSDFQISK